MNKIRSTLLAAAGALLLLVAALFFVPKEDRVELLYATQGDRYDTSAYDNLQQTLTANAYVAQRALDKLSESKLRHYDSIYLDPALQHTDTLRKALPKLADYVRQGGHLFLENGFAADFPLDLLGVSALTELAPGENYDFEYPEADYNAKGIQQVFKLFAGNYAAHVGFTNLSNFSWGKGVVPTTAETLVKLNGTAAMTLNRVGKGTVLLASTFLPNRYYITGYDLQSGMDPAQGFADMAKKYSGSRTRPEGVKYFDFKNPLPLQPYFQFAFASANAQLRNAYVTFVSKETLGYSVNKVLGPYGRPAMAYQNHFEAMLGFQGNLGIKWAEMLKDYNQIPSFSLVRAEFEWGLWQENIIVHLNTGTAQAPKFAGEYANSFYSSGARLVSEGKPLKLAKYYDPDDKETVSGDFNYRELADKISLPYRAYPAFADLSGSGRDDLLAGSADGFVYVYRSLGANDAAYASQPLPAGLQTPDAYGPPERLKLADGKPLTVGPYAAIAAADLNGDGRTDLVLGNAAGELYAALATADRAVFAAPVRLTAGGKPMTVAGNAAPALGDVDGDGKLDLVVGDSGGGVTLFRGIAGKPLTFEQGVPIAQLASRFAAPALADWNADGKLDLLVGNDEGDVQLFLQQPGGTWLKQGPIPGDTLNMMGTNALVGGHNSVPIWHDVNRDGRPDLIVGQVAFGDPVTIDDPNFPFKNQLKQMLDYMSANKVPIYPHVYVHHYVSDAQEKTELALQRETFKKLGIPWIMPGTNQHTWRINNPDRLQTLRNENEQDIWFNFGFRPSDSTQDPLYGLDYMWSMPFLVSDPSLKSPMVAGAPVYQYMPKGKSEDIFRSLSALDMPIDYFEHIENKLGNPIGTQNVLMPFVKFLDKLRTEQDYNFMVEPQFAQTSLTALTAKVKVNRSWGLYLVDKIKNRIGKGKHLSLTLNPLTGDVPKQAGDYKDALGVAIEPGKALQGQPLAVDSPIYSNRAASAVEDSPYDKLYAGLYGTTKLKVSWKADSLHIVRVNVPVDITQHTDSWTIALNGEGMQQIKLYSPEPLTFEGKDLKIEEDKEQHTYTVTHFGDKTTITAKLR